MTKDYYNQFVRSVFPERLPFKLINKMKLTCLSLCLSIGLTYASSSYAQSASISLNITNQTVADVLETIEKQSEFNFFYNGKLVDVERKVSVNATNKDVYALLDQLFEATNVAYKVVDKDVILTINQINKTDQDKRTITGTVLDINKEPLIGASVIVKGTTLGVITDFDGKFTLDVPKDTELHISYIGYLDKYVPVKSKNVFNVVLLEDVANLEELVVVGYGVQKKVNLTGAVSVVSGKDMTKRPVVNPTTMLQGQVPGVRINQGTGQPGSEGVSIRVRGQGTFSDAGSNPLVLINGIPGSLDNLDPSVIESVSVLKDAASAAIYGARAANGVILVTTKQGAAGSEKPIINYHGNFAFHAPTKLFDMVTNSVEYMELANMAKDNSGLGGKYPQEEIDKYRQANGSDQYPNFDWQDYMFNTAFVQNHNLSLAGSSERSTYNVALNYVDQEGTMQGYNYKKYNVSVDLTSKITDWMKMGTYATMKHGDIMKTRQSQGDAFLSTLSQAPTYMPWLPDDGSGIRKYTSSAYDFEQHNKNMPAIIDTETNKPEKDFDINAQVWLDINLTKGLSWYTKGAVRLENKTWKDWRGSAEPIYNYHTGAAAGELDKGGIGMSEGHSKSLYTNLYTYLKYAYTSAEKKHNFSVMAGYSQEANIYEHLNAYRRDYPFDLPTIGAGGTTGWNNGGGMEEWALMSLFGRVNYNYKERYLVEANMRYDGSSRIAEEGRWGLFPSFSGAWRITEEQFIKDLDLNWLTNAKIRASWGKLGNQNIGLYPYQAMIAGVNTYPFNNKDESLAYIQTVFANNSIKWETTTMTDIGLDLTLFNKLNVTAGWYKKYTTDILRSSQVSWLLGLDAPTVNSGEVENQGLELSLNWRDMIQEGAMKGFEYNVGFYIDRVRNKLAKFGSDEISGYSILSEGLPYAEYYMLDCVGVFANQEEIDNSPTQFTDSTQPGDLKYRDANNDGIIDNDDRITMPGRFASFEYSVNLGASWKGFDLSLIGQGVEGKKYYTSQWGAQPFLQGSAPTRDYLEGMWTPENPNNAKHPKLYWSDLGGSKNTRASDYYLQDASYFRLKNLTIGYTLPKHIAQKIAAQRLRLYFSGDNLLTFTKYNGLDPERSGDGVAAQYPQNRIMSLGVNVEF